MEAEAIVTPFWLWLIIGIGILAAIGAIAGIVGTRPAEEKKKEEQKANTDFYKELRRRIDLGVITNLEDIALIQQSIPFTSHELASLLQGYLLTVTDKDEFRFIQELLNIERSEKPFSVLPDRERGIAEALERAIKAQQEDFALSQLRELTTSLGTKLRVIHDEVNSTRRWGRWAVYAAIAAIVLAFVFGLLALIT